MPFIKLPLIPDLPLSIEGSAEQLAAFLAPVNSSFIVSRIGEERLVCREGSVLVTAGERFGNKTQWSQGHRYISVNSEGGFISVLNVSVRRINGKTQAVASNTYTDINHRRQGLASQLMKRALEDFPNMYADSTLTEQGAALVGVSSQRKKFKP